MQTFRTVKENKDIALKNLSEQGITNITVSEPYLYCCEDHEKCCYGGQQNFEAIDITYEEN